MARAPSAIMHLGSPPRKNPDAEALHSPNTLPAGGRFGLPAGFLGPPTFLSTQFPPYAAGTQVMPVCMAR
jgi:hypothetical protein